jgi:signal transduction histidine kinase
MRFFTLNLKTKITGMVLILFLCSIWLLTLFISEQLERDMADQIEKQQFSISSYIANIIEHQVKLRISALSTIASNITPELIAHPNKLREFLRSKPLLLNLFQTGVVVISNDGNGIADYPVLSGRAVASYTELEYFKEVVTTKRPSVGKPRIGRFSNKPGISIAVPVLTQSGELIAVLAGYVLLTDPLLFGLFDNSIYKDFPDGLLLTSPKYRMHIIGSDPSRIMTPTPATGINPLFDRFMAGFEGSGNTVNIRGIRIFLSAKQIPTPGWFVRVGLPTEMAFAPIHKIKILVYSITLGLSMLSCLLVWLVIRQALRPLDAASRLIQDITEERLPLQNIPVSQPDEIGQLLTSFNVHLNYRKEAEQALAKKSLQLEDLNKNLEARVEEELVARRKNEQILIQQSKMAAMGEMLGAIAHQWRQPLNVVGLIVQNMQEVQEKGRLNAEYVDKSVQKAMMHIDHMSRTIDDFRNFFKPDKGKKVFDTMRAVCDVLSLLSAELSADMIAWRLTCHTHGKTFYNQKDIIECAEKTIEGYQNEFEHVVLNLINNARDAILANRRSGNREKSEKGLLSFDFYNMNGKIIIEVSDNGGGIPPGVIDRIFEPYFTTKDTAKGTGMGLYMSKVIVEEHLNGMLTAKNNEEGATFTIALPQQHGGEANH